MASFAAARENAVRVLWLRSEWLGASDSRNSTAKAAKCKEFAQLDGAKGNGSHPPGPEPPEQRHERQTEAKAGACGSSDTH